jgi:hypothetical protein
VYPLSCGLKPARISYSNATMCGRMHARGMCSMTWWAATSSRSDWQRKTTLGAVNAAGPFEACRVRAHAYMHM